MTETDKIRMRISTNRLSHTWLIFQLRQRNIETDKTEFSAVMAGTRKGPKADLLIETANAILDQYDASEFGIR